MIRRITEHLARTNENELLQIVTVYENGIRLRDIEKMNRYSKHHAFLTKRRNKFKLIEK